LVLSNYYLHEFLKNSTTLTGEQLLTKLELDFGGYSPNVAPTITKDDVVKIYPNNHTGGNRFNPFIHDYSKTYWKYLEEIRDLDLTIVEIGILTGIGLAVWDSFFSNAKIFGFDYDLGNFKLNKNTLIELGAFQKRLPTLALFDQFGDNSKLLRETFGKEKIDVVIDDGYHSDESILNSFGELRPYLSENFIYFIEDNVTVIKKLKEIFPQYIINNHGEITVIKNFK
jgi:hypothetical protein